MHQRPSEIASVLILEIASTQDRCTASVTFAVICSNRALKERSTYLRADRQNVRSGAVRGKWSISLIRSEDGKLLNVRRYVRQRASRFRRLYIHDVSFDAENLYSVVQYIGTRCDLSLARYERGARLFPFIRVVSLRKLSARTRSTIRIFLATVVACWAANLSLAWARERRTERGCQPGGKFTDKMREWKHASKHARENKTTTNRP